jgi:nicotinamide riboside transporter PnuC
MFCGKKVSLYYIFSFHKINVYNGGKKIKNSYLFRKYEDGIGNYESRSHEYFKSSTFDNLTPKKWCYKFRDSHIYQAKLIKLDLLEFKHKRINSHWTQLTTILNVLSHYFQVFKYTHWSYKLCSNIHDICGLCSNIQENYD